MKTVEIFVCNDPSNRQCSGFKNFDARCIFVRYESASWICGNSDVCVEARLNRDHIGAKPESEASK